MRKALKWIAIGLAVLVVAIQAVRPAKTNPTVDETRTIQANTQMSPQVAAIFERACNDCHSSKTVWPWYSQIAPVSWLLVDDVNGGRKEFSLSDWASYDSRRAARKLQQICEMVEKDEMPLKIYLLLHRDATLSDSDKRILCDWATEERERVLASSSK